MSEYRICDCNQGRLPCTCKKGEGIPFAVSGEFEDETLKTVRLPFGKPFPPAPPPMRGPSKPPSDFGAIILTIIFSMAVGIACGWQMHGGVCS